MMNPEIPVVENVVSLASYREKKSPPKEMIEINGVQYPKPSSPEEYLWLVKSALLANGQEEDYQLVLCAIMDHDYYMSVKVYYEQRKELSDVPPIHLIVDAYNRYVDEALTYNEE